jgi:hypothetical protein
MVGFLGVSVMCGIHPDANNIGHKIQIILSQLVSQVFSAIIVISAKRLSSDDEIGTN